MAVATTTYDVIVSYKLNDSASNSLKDIARHTQTTANLFRQLRNALLLLHVGGPLTRGFKDALIDYNARIEESRLKLTAIAHMNLDLPWKSAKKASGELFEGLREDAIKSPATFQELTDFAVNIESGFLRAGGSLRAMREFTTGAVVASKMLGMENIAALDIQQALNGQLTIRDRFARAMLEPMGMSHVEFNKIARKDPEEAIRILTKAFTSPTIKEALKEYRFTFIGASSIFKENLQKAFGEIGMPLFKAITDDMVKINEWLENNPKKVAELVRDVGEGLKSGFLMIKDAVSYVVENRETLMTVAKLWLALKGVGAMAGVAGMAGAGGVVGALGAFAGALVVATAAAVGLSAVFGQLDREADVRLNQQGNREALADYMYKSNLHLLAPQDVATDPMFGHLVSRAQDMGALDLTKKTLDRGAWMKGLGLDKAAAEMQLLEERGDKNGLRKLQIEIQYANEAFVHLNDWLRGFTPPLSLNFWNWGLQKAIPAFEAIGRRRAMRDKDVNVTINKIEVTSEDPDRFVHGMVNAFNDIADNPTQARGAMREISGR
jgi:hypothetical protein